MALFFTKQKKTLSSQTALALTSWSEHLPCRRKSTPRSEGLPHRRESTPRSEGLPWRRESTLDQRVSHAGSSTARPELQCTCPVWEERSLNPAPALVKKLIRSEGVHPFTGDILCKCLLHKHGGREFLPTVPGFTRTLNRVNAFKITCILTQQRRR